MIAHRAVQLPSINNVLEFIQSVVQDASNERINNTKVLSRTLIMKIEENELLLCLSIHVLGNFLVRSV